MCITDAATRIYNLLNVFNLKECIHTPGSKLEITRKCDWDGVNKTIHEERKKSVEIIKDMLKD